MRRHNIHPPSFLLVAVLELLIQLVFSIASTALTSKNLAMVDLSVRLMDLHMTLQIARARECLSIDMTD